MMTTKHAAIRAQQRGIPPLIDAWLDEFGEEEYDGRGGIRRYFSRRSIRKMEKELGSQPVRRLAEYLDAYKIESSDNGQVITIGHLKKRIMRK
jgi:hypothetical protein